MIKITCFFAVSGVSFICVFEVTAGEVLLFLNMQKMNLSKSQIVAKERKHLAFGVTQKVE